MTHALSIGDRVWFISKFGDRVTGVYEGDDTIPGTAGDVAVHVVTSHNAFGEASTTPTSCVVPIGKLNREPPS